MLLIQELLERAKAVATKHDGQDFQKRADRELEGCGEIHQEQLLDYRTMEGSEAVFLVFRIIWKDKPNMKKIEICCKRNGEFKYTET